MAGYIGEADILVGADASRFEAGLHRAVSSASKFVSSNLGQSFADVGKQMENVGGKLTRGITLPAVGAAAAAAGITAALGWKRLVSIDTAQAQLRGLGYSTEDVTRISDQLAKALEGGMLTMGEATNAAAAGMAAGVSEGKELTRYIQILDGAVAGSNGTFDEMNQIFARIQGSGKLMTGELQMIEQRMPGFTATMADSLGVTQEELAKMVTAGEISSAEFLDIMEDFAGDMATEYAKSWEGMVQNTLAYIGILGQALLGGVFEQSKESIAQFLDLLSSEQAQAWAAETGEAIGDAFTRIVDAVSAAVQWFIDLPAPVQAFAGALAVAAISAGPLILGMGKLIGLGFQAVAAFQVAGAALSGWRLAASGAQLSAKALTGATSAQTVAAYAGATASNVWAAATRLARGAMVGLWTSMKANPLGWILGAIAAVAAALTYFFTQTETGQQVWANFMSAMEPVFEKLQEIGGVLLEVGASLLETLAPVMQEVLASMMPAIESIIESFGQIAEAVAPLVPMFAEAGGQIVAAFAPVIETIVSELVPVILELAMTLLPILMQIFLMLVPVLLQVVEAIAPLVAMLISELAPVILEIITTLMPVLMQVFMAVIPVILQLVAALMPLIVTIIEMLVPAIQAILDIVVAVFQAIAPIIVAALGIVISIIQTVIAVLQGDWSAAWQGILAILKGVWDLIVAAVQGAIKIVAAVIDSTMSLIFSLWGGTWAGIGNVLSSIWNTIKSVVSSSISAVSNFISSTLSRISSLWSSIWRGVSSTFSSIWSSIVSAARGFMSSVQSTFSSVLSFIGSIPSKVLGMFSGMGSLLVGAGRSLINGFKNGIMNAFSSVRSAVSSGLSSIRNLFPFSPAKEGPFSGRGWVEYGGESVGETFADSIAQSLARGTQGISRALEPISMEFNRPDFARTVIPLVEPARAQAGVATARADTMERPLVVQGPLVSIEGGLTVDSDDRVRQLSQELWNRANRTNRAQGKVNLGGVVRQ